MSDNATCVKRTVLIDCRVEADLRGTFRWSRFESMEQFAKRLEQACREFEEFVRDHRSQDNISLTVIREHQDQCSACGGEWETYTEGGRTHCAHCGRAVTTEEVAA